MTPLISALLLVAIIAAADGAETKSKRMNFVFMFPDTLRAESFSSYGFPLETTPNLDAFAKTAVRFDQAHVLHTQCSPSRATMLTGRYMHVLGHRTQQHLVQPYEYNYFQILKENGYHILYLGKNDGFSQDSFNLSMSEWSRDIGVDSGVSAVPYEEAGYYSMLNKGGDHPKDDTRHNGDYRAVAKTVAWLKNSPPEPFLVFLAGRGGHPPYGAPREFNDKWTPEAVKDALPLRPPYIDKKPKYHSRERGIPHYRNLTSLNDDFFYKIQSTYLGMISYTDWIFGQLLDGIREAGFENNTAIFFSSDHGDFSGDYHLVEKWPGGADDILTRVPLYARIPNAAPAAKGFVARAPVQLFDVPHTICELAGIDLEPHGRGSGKYGVFFGQSLTSQLRDGIEGDMSRFVYSEGGFGFWNEVFPNGSDHITGGPTSLYYPRAMEEMSEQGNGSPRWVMRRNLTHKLVYRPRGESELYDYTADPRELHNLWDDSRYTEVRGDMMDGLMSWLVETSDVTPTHQDPRGTPPYPQPASACAVSGADGPDNSVEEMESFLTDDPLYHINLQGIYPDLVERVVI